MRTNWVRCICVVLLLQDCVYQSWRIWKATGIFCFKFNTAKFRISSNSIGDLHWIYFEPEIEENNSPD